MTMSHFVFYSFSVIVCSGMFMLLYNLFVSRKADYTSCRRFILITMLLSVVIPTLDVPLYHKQVKTEQAVAAVSDQVIPAGIPQTAGHDSEQDVMTVMPAGTVGERGGSDASLPNSGTSGNVDSRLWDSIDWSMVLLIIYLAGVLVSIGMILKSIYYISGIRNKSVLTKGQGYTLAVNACIKSPFSFLHTIFMGQEYGSNERRQIMSHEMSHVQHNHSFEKLAMSLLRSVFWFNPFIWMAEKSLEEVQEWQADNDALSDGYNVDDYRDTVVRMLFGMSPLATTGMNSSFTKRRLLRMKEKESTGHMLAVSILTLTVASALFLCFGCKAVDEERLINDDDREMPGNPPFNKTEGEYRKYIENDDRLFLRIDNLVYGKKDDAEPIKRTFFLEKRDSWGDLAKSLEIVEDTKAESYPTMICINGYECADFPTSSALKWVDDKTIIVIGDKLATVEDFHSLKPEDYLCIVYYRPRADKRNTIPSLVYAITAQSVDYYGSYNYQALIDTPDADLPEIISPGSWGIHGNYFIYSSNKHVVAVTPHYAIDGMLVSFEEYRDNYESNRYGIPLILRNSQAAKRFGNDVRVVVELRSRNTVRVHFSNVNGMIMTVINGQEYPLSELSNLSKILSLSQEMPENDPLTYVEIFLDQENNGWITDELVEHIRQYIPWDDPALIINAFRKITVKSKPASEIGFNRYNRAELIEVLPD